MKKTNESGRSMVEMLGVLAIIGVLSVGGIAGYTRAMRTWRVNEIFDAANRVAALVETEIASDHSLTYNAMVGNTTDGAGAGPVSHLAGGIVSQITAYDMAHASKPSTVEVTLKNDAAGKADIIALAKEKLGCTRPANAQQGSPDPDCMISRTYKFTIQ